MVIQNKAKALESTKKEGNSMAEEVTSVPTIHSYNLGITNFDDFLKAREGRCINDVKYILEQWGFNDVAVSGDLCIAKVIKCVPDKGKSPNIKVSFDVISCRTLEKKKIVYSFKFYHYRENQVYWGTDSLFDTACIKWEFRSDGISDFEVSEWEYQYSSGNSMVI